jgi:choline dehydrogenase-like flavoprotein
MSQQHHTLLIVGGGAAGVSVANNMRRQNAKIDIALIEPSEKHYYQPGFTIIGGGAYTLKQTTRNEADLIHPTVTWIKDYAESFQPDENSVTLRSGETISYDYLVVCPGLQLDWDKIKVYRKRWARTTCAAITRPRLRNIPGSASKIWNQELPCLHNRRCRLNVPVRPKKLCIWRLIVFVKNAYWIKSMLSFVTPAPLCSAFLFSPKP